MAQTNAQRRRARQETARSKVEEMRAAQQRAEQRRKLTIIGVTSLVVLAVIAAIVIGGLGKSDPPAPTATDLPASVVQAATTVPASTLATVGIGDVTGLPQPAQGRPLSADGKPVVLYIGAEYCPFCAAERWPIVVALSQFGEFSDLGATTSAADDVFPNTPTFSFSGAGYDSDHIAFVGKELATNQREGDSYGKLDTLTATEQQEFTTLTGGQQGFPFVDFAGSYTISGSQFDPTVLQGKSLTEIADSLADPGDPVSRAVNGAANTITATVCQLTEGQPADVCDTPLISDLRAQLDSQAPADGG